MPGISVLVIATTLLTGFAGLVYEVTWQKYLANILGSQAQATALVLAVFLGGLSLGYQLFGNLSRSRSARQLVKMTGWAELLIGVWAFFFDSVFAFCMNTFGIIDPAKPYSFLTDIAISVIVIGFPTVLMGVTLPLLTQALSATVKDSGPMHARIYAVNTAGAFLGCLSAGFFFLPTFGLPLTMLYMATTNCICGFILVYSGKYLPDTVPSVEEPATPNVRASRWRFDPVMMPIKLTALLAGFCALTIQTALIRLTGLAMGSSEYSFSMVVSAYILLLALGAWRISRKKTSSRSLMINQIVALLGLIAVYLSIDNWSYVVHVIRTIFTDTTVSFYAFHLICFLVLLVALAIPVGAMGRTMPLLFNSSSARLDLVGKNVGSIYAWNAIGCIVGAYFGGYLLFYYLNLDDLLKVCIAVLGITAIIAVPWRLAQTGNSRSKAALIALPAYVMLAVAVYFLPATSKQRLSLGLFRSTKVTHETFQGAEAMYQRLRLQTESIYYKDGPTGTLALMTGRAEERIEGEPEDYLALTVNGKPDGKSCCYDKRTFEMSAHIPAMLHGGSSGSVAVIGFGTGLSIGAFTLYDDLKKVDIYEISPTVRDIAPRFDFANHNVTKNPKVSWYLGDAYRLLASSDRKYSIIVSQPSNPWVSGVERLFTQDFFKLTRNKLEDGGIYVQWAQLYMVSDETIALIINTFKSVFPYVRVFAVEEHDLAILGSNSPIDKTAIERMQARYDANPIVQAKLRQIGIQSVDGILAREYAIDPAFFRGAGLHSLDFPRLAFAAGKDFYLQKRTNFNNVADSIPAKAYQTRSYRQTLLAQKYDSQRIASMSDSELRKLIGEACRSQGEVTHQEQVFSFARRFCIPLYWTAMVAKGGKVENLDAPPGMLDMIAALRDPKLLPASMTPQQAMGYLSIAAQIAATGISISPEAVAKIISACDPNDPSALECQVEGMKARISLLDGQGASNQFAQFQASPLGIVLNPEVAFDIQKGIQGVDDTDADAPAPFGW